MHRHCSSTLLDIFHRDARTVLLTGCEPETGFHECESAFPERCFSMPCSAPMIVSIAAGMAAQGYVPFIFERAPLITERSIEHIKVSACYNRLGINIISSGATFDHSVKGVPCQCCSDIALMRMLPHTEVVQPGSCRELGLLLRSQYNNGLTTYFRLSGHPHCIELPVKFGEGLIIKNAGARLTVMTAGPALHNVLEACRDQDVNLVYFHTLKPIDKNLIYNFKNTNILVIHDAFGLYEAVSEIPDISASHYGIKDEFYNPYGSHGDMLRSAGLDTGAIRNIIRQNVLKSDATLLKGWETASHEQLTG